MSILSPKGFTMIEMAIALCLGSIVMVTMFTAFRSQERSYQSQEDVVDLQQSVRAGLSLIADDLRMAGYDPDGEYDLGFNVANENELEITMVSNWDGVDNTNDTDVDEDGEQNIIHYYLDPNKDNPAVYSDLVREADGLDTTPEDRVRVIENIRGNRIRFLYTLQDGSGPFTQVAGISEMKEIVKVDIFVLVESASQIHQANYLRSYDVPSGVQANGMPNLPTSWAVTGRHMFLQKTIFCRNMVY